MEAPNLTPPLTYRRKLLRSVVGGRVVGTSLTLDWTPGTWIESRGPILERDRKLLFRMVPTWLTIHVGPPDRDSMWPTLTSLSYRRKLLNREVPGATWLSLDRTRDLRPHLLDRDYPNRKLSDQRRPSYMRPPRINCASLYNPRTVPDLTGGPSPWRGRRPPNPLHGAIEMADIVMSEGRPTWTRIVTVDRERGGPSYEV